MTSFMKSFCNPTVSSIPAAYITVKQQIIFPQTTYLKSSLLDKAVVMVEKTGQHIKHHDAGGDELMIFSLADMILRVSSRKEDALDLVVPHLVGGLVGSDQELAGFQRNLQERWS